MWLTRERPLHGQHNTYLIHEDAYDVQSQEIRSLIPVSGDNTPLSLFQGLTIVFLTGVHVLDHAAFKRTRGAKSRI